MEVPAYPLAERDRRWALARKLMAAEEVDALIAYGAHECAGEAGLAPDSYFIPARAAAASGAQAGVDCPPAATVRRPDERTVTGPVARASVRDDRDFHPERGRVALNR